MKKLLIYNEDIPNLDIFDNQIKFRNIQDAIDKIEKEQFDILYIQDNLTKNHMEFQGLILAHHIRLTPKLNNKRFTPIVIITHLDGIIINKFTTLGRILFTKNIFLNREPINDIIFNEDNFKNDFLDKIIIERPDDISDNHDIANEWSIYQWSKFLNIEIDNISSKLYFKYLISKNQLPKKTGLKFMPKKPKQKGKILYIDDEWNKGWGDIFNQYFSNIKNIDFKIFEEDFKDKNYNDIEIKIIEQINDIDLVLLDLRLLKNDHNRDSKIDNLSGIKLLETIKNINQGIQIIMLTASGRSIILEKLQKYDIVGYIKKAHPEDKNISPKKSFEKLAILVDDGLEKSYLKEVWNIQKEILKVDILQKKDENYQKIKYEIGIIFDILNSNIENKFKFALLTIYKVFEIICDIYISNKKKPTKENSEYYFYLENEKIEKYPSIENELKVILQKKFNLIGFSDKITEMVNIRNNLIHVGDMICDKNHILIYFKILKNIFKSETEEVNEFKSKI
jgi:CheY-like chemotaxis protein